MDTVYRFKHHLRVVPVGSGLVFLLGELEHFVLKGRLHELIAPLIDGQRSVLQIIESLDGKVSPPEVVYIVNILRERGYILERTTGLAPESAAFWEAVGVDADRVAKVLSEAAVAVAIAGEGDTSPLIQGLGDAGLAIRESAPFRVVLTHDYLEPDLDRIDADARQGDVRWLPVKLSGPTCWIGPIMQPNVGACWTCLSHRLRFNRPDRAFVQRRLGMPAPTSLPRAETNVAVQAGARLAVLEVVRLLTSTAPQRLLTLDYARLTTSEHPIVRRPQCPACGDGELIRKRAWEPLHLEPRRKAQEDDGGYRCVTAEETFERLKTQISPITGIVTHIAPVPVRDHPLRPVYSSGYFSCPSHDDPSLDEFGRPSLGKGRTASQARTGALAEGIERYSALFQGDEALILAKFTDLEEQAIHPHELQNFSDAQYRNRETINQRVRELRRSVPAPFDDEIAIHWTPAWSLTQERRRYVPATYSYLYTAETLEAEYCGFNPNGHAAGNCLEEAILQAFLEVTERDAIAIWWYNRLRRPQVLLGSFDEPYFEALQKHYRSMGHRIWVLDITNDLEIPAFAALARAEDGSRWCIGFGCHLDARLGVQRALTELNQLFDPTGRAPAPWNDAAMTDRSFLLPDESSAPRASDDFRREAHENLRDDIMTCVKRASHVGLETIVLDQTRPDAGLCAAKVIVPGLRHIWPRLGPGRLYDVPVKLGWLNSPNIENELNPVHLFL
jgi:ribosomal protein S12 methylthiotransferase accessory factor